jgi:hypothetical protein
MNTTATTEYRIRQAQHGRLFSKPVGQVIKTEWVIEQKRAPVEGEDAYSYERDCWVQITSGATEREAKKAFVVWLNAEIEAASFDDGR